MFPALAGRFFTTKHGGRVQIKRLDLESLIKGIEKEGKTTRPFRYDLNQIPYDYTVEVRNRFKGLDLIDRLPDELWMEVRDIV